MAVGAFGHTGKAQVGNLAVVGMTIGLQKSTVTAPAFLHDVEDPLSPFHGLDVMGGMTTDASRCAFITLL